MVVDTGKNIGSKAGSYCHGSQVSPRLSNEERAPAYLGGFVGGLYYPVHL